ncbi:MAG: sensor histidine kinase [Chakrabartia sp.]
MSPILLATALYGSPNKLGFVASYLSLIVAYFAVGTRQGLRPVHKMSTWLILASTPFPIYFLVAPFSWQSVAIAYCAGIMTCIACGLATLKNRAWRGVWGQVLLGTGFLLSSVLLVWRIWTIYNSQTSAGLRFDPDVSLTSVQMLVVNSFFLQLGFLGVVIERGFRAQRFVVRRAARAFAKNQALIDEQKVLASLAEERLDTLQLLIHEVRQPINNAQAALQSLDYEVRHDASPSTTTQSAIGRAQAVLDTITLALSNAIFGASIIGDRQSLVKQSVNIVDLAELAISDCSSEMRARIQLKTEQLVISVEVDPILLRLALRNLLDNALKYSPAQSPVLLDVRHDDERLGISFRVRSEMRSPDLLDGRIFERRRRGRAARGDGSGLGLYLVRQVAQLHHGDVSYQVEGDKHVVFDLFIAM